MENKIEAAKYIKYSQFDTYIHGGRNGGTHQNIWGGGFIYDNGKTSCMKCDGQVIYRGRK